PQSGLRGRPVCRRSGDRAPASGVVRAGVEDAVRIPGNNLGSGCGRLARAGRVQVRWHRGSLATVLSAEADLDVIAELGRLQGALPVARAVHPDVAVIGADLLDDAGMSTLEELHREVPSCAVVVLVDTYVPGAVRAEREPYVRGFIGRDTTPGQLADHIRRVANGERVIDPILAVATLRAPHNPLTPREREVLRIAALGVPSNEIASRLH